MILLLLLLPVHFAKVGSLNNLHRIVVNKDNNSLTPTPIKRRRRQHKDAGCCLKIKSIERIDKQNLRTKKHHYLTRQHLIFSQFWSNLLLNHLHRYHRPRLPVTGYRRSTAACRTSYRRLFG